MVQCKPTDWVPFTKLWLSVTWARSLKFKFWSHFWNFVLMKRIFKDFEQSTSNTTSSCLCIDGYGVLFLEFRHQQGNTEQGLKILSTLYYLLVLKGRHSTSVVVRCNLSIRGKTSSHAPCSILMTELCSWKFHSQPARWIRKVRNKSNYT